MIETKNMSMHFLINFLFSLIGLLALCTQLAHADVYWRDKYATRYDTPEGACGDLRGMPGVPGYVGVRAKKYTVDNYLCWSFYVPLVDGA